MGEVEGGIVDFFLFYTNIVKVLLVDSSRSENCIFFFWDEGSRSVQTLIDNERSVSTPAGEGVWHPRSGRYLFARPLVKWIFFQFNTCDVTESWGNYQFYIYFLV